jgi:hypothetical protein
LVAGGRDALLDILSNATSAKLRDYLDKADANIRGQVVSFMTRVSTKLIAHIKLKTDYLFHIPHLFLGCLAHVYADMDISYSRDVCRQCLRERDELIGKGLAHKLDKITVFLAVGDKNQRRDDLERFQQGGSLGVHAFNELRQYALASLVTRRVEAAHSILKGHSRRATYHRPILMNARMKRPEIDELLDHDGFFRFAAANFSQRRMACKLIEFTLPRGQRWRSKFMNEKQAILHLHLSSSSAQFRPLTIERTVQTEHKKYLDKVVAKQTETVGEGCRMLTDYMKCFFEDDGDAIWSLPKTILSRFESAGVSEVAGLPLALQVVLAAPAAPADVSTVVFFKVLQARPEAKKLVRTPATMASRSRLDVKVQVLSVSRWLDDIVELASEPNVSSQRVVNLGTLATICDMASLLKWQTVRTRSLPFLDFAAIRSLDNFQVLLPLIGAVYVFSEDDQLAVHNPAAGVGLQQEAANLFHSLCVLDHRRESRNEVLMTSAMDLNGFDARACGALVECGVLLTAVDEFGEVLYGVNPDRVRWSISYVVKTWQSLFSIEAPQSSTNKLALFRTLFMQGWTLTDAFVDKYTKDSSLHLHASYISRPASMLQALAVREVIISQKGSPHILMGKPDGYYRCLLVLDDLRAFHNIRGFERFKHTDFMALSKGLEPPEIDVGMLALEGVPGLLAIEDGDDDAGDPPDELLVGVSSEHAVASFAIPAMRFENGITIVFDNFTHSSGLRRALCVCRDVDRHGRCEKYAFLHHHSNCPRLAAAWLVAWESLSTVCATHLAHLDAAPTESDVLAALSQIV